MILPCLQAATAEKSVAKAETKAILSIAGMEREERVVMRFLKWSLVLHLTMGPAAIFLCATTNQRQIRPAISHLAWLVCANAIYCFWQ